MKADVRIAGGIVQSPRGALEADILVTGEQVGALVGRDVEGDAASVIDASGRWIMPGIVDLHAHTRVPGYEYKEDYRTASRAAAVGGVTTFVDMPNVEPPTDSVELLEAKREIAARDSIVDWGHFVSPSRPEQIGPMAAAGATGFKIFQVSGGYPHDPRLAMTDPAQVLEAFYAVAETGLPCAIHPFSQTVFEWLSEREWSRGRPRDPRTFSEVYTKDVVWSSAVGLLLELQRESGVRLHLLHTHSQWSLRLIRDAKRDGVRVTVAVDPKYFHLTDAELVRQDSRAMPGGFVTENPERMASIWQSLDDGNIDIIDSDHAPHTLEDLVGAARDPWTGAWGGPHYEHMLPLLLTDVREGRLRIERLVALLCENPARIVGLYPWKGALQPGSSADLVIIDPDEIVIPRDGAMESKVKWTPYEGWELVGRPVLTMLRGQVISRDGKVTGEHGYGRFIAGRPQGFASITPELAPGLALEERA